MAEEKQASAETTGSEVTEEVGGSYDVIRERLVAQAKELSERASKLNVARVSEFGGTELAVIGNERVRTENNCLPRDILQVGGRLLFGDSLGLQEDGAMLSRDQQLAMLQPDEPSAMQRYNPGAF